MDTAYIETLLIDSVCHIPTHAYQNEQTIQLIGAPSVHEHIILNDNCALITIEIDGKAYESEEDMVFGKFTNIPKIKIVFKNTDKQLTVIRLVSCGLFKLTDMPIASMVNRIVPKSILGRKSDADQDKPYRLNVTLKEDPSVSASYALIQEIIRYVNSDFALLPANATKAVAEKFGTSESSLRRYFKKYLGITLSTYIMTVKRRRMIQSLYKNHYDSMSVRENGYYDQSHFLNDFKRLYGLPLKQYVNHIEFMKHHAPDLMNCLYYSSETAV